MEKRIIFQQLYLLLAYFIVRLLIRFIRIPLDWPLVVVGVLIVSIGLLCFFMLYKGEKETIVMSFGLTAVFLGTYFIIPADIKATLLNELGMILYFPLIFLFTFLVIAIKRFIVKIKKRIKRRRDRYLYSGRHGSTVDFILNLLIHFSAIALVMYAIEHLLK